MSKTKQKRAKITSIDDFDENGMGPCAAASCPNNATHRLVTKAGEVIQLCTKHYWEIHP